MDVLSLSPFQARLYVLKLCYSVVHSSRAVGSFSDWKMRLVSISLYDEGES